MKNMRRLTLYFATGSGARIFKFINKYWFYSRIRLDYKIVERRKNLPLLWGNIAGQNGGVEMWGNSAFSCHS